MTKNNTVVENKKKVITSIVWTDIRNLERTNKIVNNNLKYVIAK